MKVKEYLIKEQSFIDFVAENAMKCRSRQDQTLDPYVLCVGNEVHIKKNNPAGIKDGEFVVFELEERSSVTNTKFITTRKFRATSFDDISLKLILTATEVLRTNEEDK